MKPQNKVVTAALDNIRALIKKQEEVAFVVHFWMPCYNLGMSGFRFPQIPDPYIPSAVLLPLVTITQSHIDSFVNPMNGKVTPFVTPFQQEIRQSIVDLQRRFGKYGLTELPNLTCTLNEAEELIGAFDLMMQSFTGTLQDLPEFFGGSSPVWVQFDNPVTRLQKDKDGGYITYDKALQALVNSGAISELNFRRLMASVNEFQQSVETAHLSALAPQSGILHHSIQAVNNKTKDGLDEADIWLTRQFPDFKVAARMTGKESNSDIDKLVELLADRVTGTPAQQAQVPAQPNLLQLLAAATPEEKAALREFLKIGAEPAAEPLAAAPSSDVTQSVDEELAEVGAFEEVTDDDAQQGLTSLTPKRCLGKTKGSNYVNQCSLDAAQDHVTCVAHLEQEPQIIAELEALSKAQPQTGE